MAVVPSQPSSPDKRLLRVKFDFPKTTIQRT